MQLRGRKDTVYHPHAKTTTPSRVASVFDTAPRGIGLDLVREICESKSESIRSFQTQPPQRRQKDQETRSTVRYAIIFGGIRVEETDAANATPTI
jgi:hypothetical protein